MSYTNFQNGRTNGTPINDTNLNAMQQGLMELVFPVGSTYITQSNTNPNTILKFGTWERLKGKVCLGLDENDDDFKTIGKTGGSKTHTQTVDEMAKHSHKIGTDGNAVVKADLSGWQNLGSGSVTVGKSTGWDGTESAGNGKAMNIMNPYEIVGYMWIRRK